MIRAGGADSVRWVVVGKKGRSTLRFRRYAIEQAWVDFTDRPVYADAVAIAEAARRPLRRARGRPRGRRLRPLRLAADPDRRGRGTSSRSRARCFEEEEKSAYEIALEGDFIYEPEPEEILGRLLPTYLETTVYRALLESAASDAGAA